MDLCFAVAWCFCAWLVWCLAIAFYADAVALARWCWRWSNHLWPWPKCHTCGRRFYAGLPRLSWCRHWWPLQWQWLPWWQDHCSRTCHRNDPFLTLVRRALLYKKQNDKTVDGDCNCDLCSAHQDGNPAGHAPRTPPRATEP